MIPWVRTKSSFGPAADTSANTASTNAYICGATYARTSAAVADASGVLSTALKILNERVYDARDRAA